MELNDVVADPAAGSAPPEPVGLSPAPARPSPEVITAWLVEHIAALLETSTDAIDPDAPLMNLALSSLEAVSLSGRLQEMLGIELPPLMIYEHPSINSLARHLGGA